MADIWLFEVTWLNWKKPKMVIFWYFQEKIETVMGPNSFNSYYVMLQDVRD